MGGPEPGTPWWKSMVLLVTTLLVLRLGPAVQALTSDHRHCTHQHPKPHEVGGFLNTFFILLSIEFFKLWNENFLLKEN